MLSEKSNSTGRSVGYVIAFLLLFLVVRVSLNRSWNSGRYVGKNPGGDDSVRARLRDPQHPRYDYVRDVDSLERMRTNFHQIKMGCTPSKVIELMGEPSTKMILQSKAKQNPAIALLGDRGSPMTSKLLQLVCTMLSTIHALSFISTKTIG